MFANDATGKGLLTKMHKQLKQQKYQENKQPDSAKWAEEPTDIFPEKTVQRRCTM